MIGNVASSRFRKIHFVGIGGAGMNGIAEVLKAHGFEVSGSDARDGETLRRLERLGIEVHVGHSAEWVKDADLVVYSSAVPKDNPERLAGVERGIPVIRRAEMLGELMRLKYSIAVAGTHGKTTTTSMIGQIWNQADLRPTIIVGGIVDKLGGGAQYGESDYLIAEADEYDRSFLEMNPSVAVLTNVDADHLDCYGDIESIRGAFVAFANKIPFYGYAVACIDDPGVREVVPKLRRRVVSYGFSAQADYRAADVRPEGASSRFALIVRGENRGEVVVGVPGRHNVLNALAAVAVTCEEGVPLEAALKALPQFAGVRRRFEHKGSAGGIDVFEDYAHHPREAEATLAAARENWPGRRVAVLFQPHLYTRTRDQAEAFGAAFLNADLLVVAPIYGAREKPIEGITSALVVEAARRRGHRNVVELGALSDAPAVLKEKTESGDIVVVMGAGDVGGMCAPILEALGK